VPPLEEPQPPPEAEAPTSALDRFAKALRTLLVAPAFAAPASVRADAASAPAEASSFDAFSLQQLAFRLNHWAPSRADAREYVPLAGELLRGIADEVYGRSGLAREHSELFRALLLATGWQESCWRQYVRRGRALAPLRSPAGAVGLMQVSETVWRGFYELDALRWDVAYNGRAGGEILAHYLRDFAIARGEQRAGGAQALARSTYAMYNGGPGHMRRWRDPKTPGALRAIDASFLAKYRAIRAGDEAGPVACYAG
jgi:soluble lytic murein transglycosylase-like protein